MTKVDPSRSFFSDLPSNVYYYLEALMQRIDECTTQVFVYLHQCLNPPRDNRDAERLFPGGAEPQKARDREKWLSYEARMEPAMDLSGIPSEIPSRQPVIQVGHYHEGKYATKKPLLCVKLPRRQLCHFPEELRGKLLNIAEDRLDLYFVIYERPKEESEDFSLILPMWGEKTIDVQVGFYEGKGIERGSGWTVPWNFIREHTLKVEERGGHPFYPNNYLRVRLTEDEGAFTAGAYSFNCERENQGIGVYGMVVSDAEKVKGAIRERKSLKDFVATLGHDQQKIFTFNENY